MLFVPVIFFRSDETSWICENELHLMKETMESQINTEHNFIEQYDSVENNWENLLTWEEIEISLIFKIKKLFRK